MQSTKGRCLLSVSGDFTKKTRPEGGSDGLCFSLHPRTCVGRNSAQRGKGGKEPRGVIGSGHSGDDIEDFSEVRLRRGGACHEVMLQAAQAGVSVLIGSSEVPIGLSGEQDGGGLKASQRSP